MFVVLTRTHFADAQKDTVIDMSKDAVDIAKRQPGFIGIRIHLAHGAQHTMTYWEWETEQDHLNCMGSADWAQWNPKWQDLLANGVQFDLETYDVVASG